jgi:hypothetical protein
LISAAKYFRPTVDTLLQTTLACDLGESLAVLARCLGHNLLGHRNVVFALEAGAGQPVAEVLL